MKRGVILVAVLFLFATCMSFSGCALQNSDIRGKELYSFVSMPSTSDPYANIYDGCHLIKIDQNDNVVLKRKYGYIVRGTMTTSVVDGGDANRTSITLEFEDGRVSDGEYYKEAGVWVLSIRYANEELKFTEESKLPKKEYKAYRRKFYAFLTKVYKSGEFPSLETIKNNELYKQFANYHQIDPCCGGPMSCTKLYRATIEKIETVVEYGSEYTYVTYNTDGNSKREIIYSSSNVLRLRYGKMTKLTQKDLRKGKCLIGENVGINDIIYMDK